MSNPVVPENVKVGDRYITATGIPEEYDYDGSVYMSHVSEKTVKMVVSITDDYVTLSTVAAIQPDVIYDRMTGLQIGLDPNYLIQYNEVNYIMSTDKREVDSLLMKMIEDSLTNKGNQNEKV